MALFFAIAPFAIIILGLICSIIYFEKSMKEDDPLDKATVRVLNIIICFFIAWIIYGVIYLYKN